MDPPQNTTTPPPIPSVESPQPQSQPPPSSASPSPNPNPKPSPPSTQPPRPRPPQPPLYSHLHHSSPSSSLPPPSLPAPSPRGAVAIGVPAHHPSPPPPSYTHFGGIARPAAGDSSSSSPVRTPMPAMQGMIVSARPAGFSPPHPQRPAVQSSLRPASSAANQSPSGQNFQGHNLSRASSLGSPSSPNTSQGLALHNQPWLGSQGKPPIPSSPYRPQMPPTSMLQRSHLQPQQQPLTTPPPQQQRGPSPTASPQQHNMPPLQHQQPSSIHQGQGHFGQQTPPQRVPQASPRQQQNTRVQASVNQKSSSLATVQPNTGQATQQNRIASTETDESCNRILSKRTIHVLVNQIDPSERLDPDVEDILVDIAEEFVESITTFGCSLAKHRKSTTLEAKDILLHLEKNWNMTLPGFGGDEIKSYKKTITNDIHKGRIAAIKKSMSVTEIANTRNSAEHATGNAKGGLAKASANISSQNIKT